MTDKEMRGIVLREFYERRSGKMFQWLELEDKVPQEVDLLRICAQLFDHGLIEGHPIKGGHGEVIGGIGKISAHGVDVMEGNEQPPLSITIDQRQISVNRSHNVQIGNNNVQDITFEKVITTINSAPESAGKQEAKSLLKKFSENPFVVATLGGSFVALVERLLERK